MYKASVFLFFLVLFSCSARQTTGQTTTKSQPPVGINNPQISIDSTVRRVPASLEPNAKARRLLEEGTKLTDGGQLSQAAETLQEAIKLDPDYADAYAALGRAFFKMRQWQKAIDNLQRAAALNTKRRQADDAPQQKLSLEKRDGVSASQTAPARPIESQETKQRAAVGPVGQAEERSYAHQPATLAATRQPPKVRNPNAAGTPPLSSLTIKSNADETKQRTSAEVTQVEKTTGEASPSNGAFARTSEEKQEPTGIRVSMNVSPNSSVESSGVPPIPIKPLNNEFSLTKVYRVGPSDVLDVRINEAQPRQSTLFTVTPAGLLEHPMLAESLNVSGLTTEEISTKIQDDLKKRALIEDAKVTVGVRDYASHTILVSGLVKDSGTKFLRREAIPLYVVVADAQPLPEAAKVTVVRNEQNEMYEIDLNKVADMSLLVRPGDVITLQPNETQFIYVGGEVKAPGEKTFRRGLTLTQAIITAGGVTTKSKVAEIGRDDGRGFLVGTRFKLKDIQSGKAIDPLIRPGDRIMILR